MKRICAIDPGAHGAVAVLWEDGKITASAFGKSEDVHDILTDACMHDGTVEVSAVLEQVGAIFPMGGKVSPKASFTFGENFGFLKGWLRAASISFRTIRPAEWQKGLPGLEGKKGPERKRALKELAARMYPQIKVTLDNCDALLILDYARRNNL